MQGLKEDVRKGEPNRYHYSNQFRPPPSAATGPQRSSELPFDSPTVEREGNVGFSRRIGGHHPHGMSSSFARNNAGMGNGSTHNSPVVPSERGAGVTSPYVKHSSPTETFSLSPKKPLGEHSSPQRMHPMSSPHVSERPPNPQRGMRSDSGNHANNKRSLRRDSDQSFRQSGSDRHALSTKGNEMPFSAKMGSGIPPSSPPRPPALVYGSSNFSTPARNTAPVIPAPIQRGSSNSPPLPTTQGLLDAKGGRRDTLSPVNPFRSSLGISEHGGGVYSPPALPLSQTPHPPRPYTSQPPPPPTPPPPGNALSLPTPLPSNGGPPSRPNRRPVLPDRFPPPTAVAHGGISGTTSGPTLSVSPTNAPRAPVRGYPFATTTMSSHAASPTVTGYPSPPVMAAPPQSISSLDVSTSTSHGSQGPGELESPVIASSGREGHLQQVFTYRQNNLSKFRKLYSHRVKNSPLPALRITPSFQPSASSVPTSGTPRYVQTATFPHPPGSNPQEGVVPNVNLPLTYGPRFPLIIPGSRYSPPPRSNSLMISPHAPLTRPSFAYPTRPYLETGPPLLPSTQPVDMGGPSKLPPATMQEGSLNYQSPLVEHPPLLESLTERSYFPSPSVVSYDKMRPVEMAGMPISVPESPKVAQTIHSPPSYSLYVPSDTNVANFALSVSTSIPANENAFLSPMDREIVMPVFPPLSRIVKERRLARKIKNFSLSSLRWLGNGYRSSMESNKVVNIPAVLNALPESKPSLSMVRNYTEYGTGEAMDGMKTKAAIPPKRPLSPLETERVPTPSPKKVQVAMEIPKPPFRDFSEAKTPTNDNLPRSQSSPLLRTTRHGLPAPFLSMTLATAAAGTEGILGPPTLKVSPAPLGGEGGGGGGILSPVEEISSSLENRNGRSPPLRAVLPDRPPLLPPPESSEVSRRDSRKLREVASIVSSAAARWTSSRNVSPSSEALGGHGGERERSFSPPSTDLPTKPSIFSSRETPSTSVVYPLPPTPPPPSSSPLLSTVPNTATFYVKRSPPALRKDETLRFPPPEPVPVPAKEVGGGEGSGGSLFSPLRTHLPYPKPPAIPSSGKPWKEAAGRPEHPPLSPDGEAAQLEKGFEEVGGKGSESASVVVPVSLHTSTGRVDVHAKEEEDTLAKGGGVLLSSRDLPENGAEMDKLATKETSLSPLAPALPIPPKERLGKGEGTFEERRSPLLQHAFPVTATAVASAMPLLRKDASPGRSTPLDSSYPRYTREIVISYFQAFIKQGETSKPLIFLKSAGFATELPSKKAVIPSTSSKLDRLPPSKSVPAYDAVDTTKPSSDWRDSALQKESKSIPSSGGTPFMYMASRGLEKTTTRSATRAMEVSMNRPLASPFFLRASGSVTSPPLSVKSAPLEPRVPQFLKGKNNLSQEEIFRREIKSLLNKLTIEKFVTVAEKIAKRSEFVTSLNELQLLVDLIYDKAVTETDYCDVYADLCIILRWRIKTSLVGKGLEKGFQWTLNVRMETEFARFPKISFQPTEEEMATLSPADTAAAVHTRKLRVLGNVRFLGRLVTRKLMYLNAVDEAATALLKPDAVTGKAPDEHLIECGIEFFTTIGYYLENIEGGTLLNKWITCFKVHLEEGQYSKRIKFKIQDLLDLRDNGWSKKIFKEKAKTVAQIHEDAYEDELKGGSIVSVQAGIYALIGGTDPQPYHAYLVEQHKLYQSRRSAKNSFRNVPPLAKKSISPFISLPCISTFPALHEKLLFDPPPSTHPLPLFEERKERWPLPSSNLAPQEAGSDLAVETHPPETTTTRTQGTKPNKILKEEEISASSKSVSKESGHRLSPISLIETFQRLSSSEENEILSKQELLDNWHTHCSSNEKIKEFMNICDWIFRTDRDTWVCKKYFKVFDGFAKDIASTLTDTSSAIGIINCLFEGLDTYYSADPPQIFISFVGCVGASLLVTSPSSSLNNSLSLRLPSSKTVAISSILAIYHCLLHHQMETFANEFWEFGKQQLRSTFEMLTMEELHKQFKDFSVSTEDLFTEDEMLRKE